MSFKQLKLVIFHERRVTLVLHQKENYMLLKVKDFHLRIKTHRQFSSTFLGDTYKLTIKLRREIQNTIQCTQILEGQC
jgi:hypothetical protein